MDGDESKQPPESFRGESSQQLRVDTNTEWPTEGQPSPRRVATAPTSPSTAYKTDREAVFRSGSATVAETHLIRSSGSQSQSFTEEHWSSEITSFVAAAPPKFIQVIKAYRVLSSDTPTLVVEVASDPPAIFEWFCNDKPVQQDRRRFQVRHGLNITTLTVSHPDQGVYKCTARNPAGCSTSYGYITVNFEHKYEEWSVSSETEVKKQRSSISHNLAPRFINQVPNLTVPPGQEAVIDVEVDANPPARFSWYVNDREFRETTDNVEIYYPQENRCVARFVIPTAGQYKVIASNVHGTAMSSGYIEIHQANPSKHMRPPLAPGEHLSRTMMSTSQQVAQSKEAEPQVSTHQSTSVYEVNYSQRSSSVPRGVRHLEKHMEMSKSPERSLSTFQRSGTEEPFEMVPPTLPEECAPKILEPLHSAAFVDGQPMVLRCRIHANPSAVVVWSKDDVDVEEWVVNKDVTTQVLAGGICELQNPEVYPEDSGLYKCHASNPHGTAETSAYIAVEGLSYVKDREEASASESMSSAVIDEQLQASGERIILPPKFVENLTPETDGYKELGYIRLVCRVNSGSPYVVTWLKEELPINESDKYEIFNFEDGTQILTIRLPIPADEGVYTCRIESEHGLSSSSCEVILPPVESLEELEMATPSPPKEEDEEIEIVNVEIPLKTEEANVEFKMPVPISQPTQQKEPIDSGNVGGFTELKKDEEEYKLLVKVADTVASALVANVIVSAVQEAARKIADETSEDEEFESVQKQDGAPRFDASAEEYVATEGDNIRISTTVGGYPTPFVEWTFKDKKVKINENLSMSYEKSVASLNMKNLKLDDEGIYFCQATNVHGTKTLTCRLKVLPRSDDIRASIDTTDNQETMKQAENESDDRQQTEIAAPQQVEVVQKAEEAAPQPVEELKVEPKEMQDASSQQQVPSEDVEIISEVSVQPVQQQVEITVSSQVVPPAAIPLHEQKVEEQTPIIAPAAFEQSSVQEEQEKQDKTQQVDKNIQEIAEKFAQTFTENVMNQAAAIVLTKPNDDDVPSSTVIASSTIYLSKDDEEEKHSQCMPYDDKIKVIENRLKYAASPDLTAQEAVNMVMNTVLSLKEQLQNDTASTVDVRNPDTTFSHVVTVYEPLALQLAHRLDATTTQHKFIDLETILQKPGTSSEVSHVVQTASSKKAIAEHRIVVLEGVSQNFQDAMTWSLKKVKKLVQQDESTNADIEVVQPREESAQVTTVVNPEEIIPELLQVAAAASKLKLENVTVSLVKQGDSSHQELVIEYESQLEDEANLAVSQLENSKPSESREEKWSRPTRYSDENNLNVVAVFVEVDATCPDQSVEIVASVNMPLNPPPSEPNAPETAQESSEQSITESSCGLQPPRFFRKLEDSKALIGHPVQFKCIVCGTPTPNITWTVDGDVIEPNQEYNIVYEDGVSILRINETLAEDEGEYCCIAVNPAGTTSTKCFLKVLNQEKDVPVNPTPAIRKSSYIQQTAHPTTVISQTALMSTDPTPQLQVTATNDSANRSFINQSSEQPHVSATFNDNLSDMKTFCKYPETGEVTVKVTEFVQEFATEASFPAAIRRSRVPPIPPPKPCLKTHLASLQNNVSSNTNADFFNSRHCPSASTFIVHKEKQQSYDSAVSPIIAAPITESAKFDKDFTDPFAEEEVKRHVEQSELVSEDKLMEPRVPLLPQRISYKGQEIGVRINEVDGNGDPHTQKKILETSLEFNTPLSVKKIILNPDQEVKDHLKKQETAILEPEIAPTKREALECNNNNIDATDSNSSEKKIIITKPYVPGGGLSEKNSLQKEEEKLKPGYVNKMKEIERIAKKVEHELSVLNLRPSQSSGSELSDDAKEIENAILRMSDQLVYNSPISEAQAEASEELMRTTLADMILNPDKKQWEEAQLMKTPIQILKRKLSDIENSLMEDVEVRDINETDPQTSLTGTSSTILKGPIKTKRVPSAELMRMTPLTTDIRDQLTTLEDMINEHINSDSQSSIIPMDPSKTPEQKRIELHDIFVQINNEINVIRQFCTKKLTKKGADAVMQVLEKVKIHVTSIVNIMTISKRKRQHALEEKKKEKVITLNVKEEPKKREISVEANLLRSHIEEHIEGIMVFKRHSMESSTTLQTSIGGSTSDDTWRYSSELKTSYSDIFSSKSKRSTPSASAQPIEEEEGCETPVPPPRRHRTMTRSPDEQLRTLLPQNVVPPSANVAQIQLEREGRNSRSTIPTKSSAQASSPPVAPPRRKRDASYDPSMVTRTEPPRPMTHRRTSLDSKQMNREMPPAIPPHKTSPTKAIKSFTGNALDMIRQLNFPNPLRKRSKSRTVDREPLLSDNQEEAKNTPTKISKKEAKVPKKSKQRQLKENEHSNESDCIVKNNPYAEEKASISIHINEPKKTEDQRIYMNVPAPESPIVETVTQSFMFQKNKDSDSIKHTVPQKHCDEEDLSRFETPILDKDGSPPVSSSEFDYDENEKTEAELLNQLRSMSGEIPDESPKDEIQFEYPTQKMELQTELPVKKIPSKKSEEALLLQEVEIPVQIPQSTLNSDMMQEHDAEIDVTSSISIVQEKTRPDSPIPEDLPTEQSVLPEESKKDELKPTQNYMEDSTETDELKPKLSVIEETSREYEPTVLLEQSATLNFAMVSTSHGTAVTNDMSTESQMPMCHHINVDCYIPADDISSVQMLCEESDYATDTDTSCMLKGTIQFFSRYGHNIGLSDQRHHSNLSLNSPQMLEPLRENVQEEQPTEDIEVNIVLKSVDPEEMANEQECHEEFIFAANDIIVQESDLDSRSEDRVITPGLRSEHVVPMASISENSAETVKVKSEEEFIDNVVTSAETIHYVLEEAQLSQMASSMKTEDLERALSSANTMRETDILTDDSVTTEVEQPIVDYVEEEFEFAQLPARRRLMATVQQDIRQHISANVAADNSFDIEITQEPEMMGLSIKVIEDQIDFTSLTVLASYENAEASEHVEIEINQQKEYEDFTETSSFDEYEEEDSKTGITVSIIARSLHDGIYASLEEIPWGEAQMTLRECEMTRSCDNSLHFNVTVSEATADEKKSLRSQASFKESQNSISEIENTVSTGSINIPSYVIKLGSTATITCELNNYLPPNSIIDWYKGKQPLERIPGKFDRISHDLLEVLIINAVEMEDNDLYSLKVNNDIFPVAFLVIEDPDTLPLFLTPPQTQFVMEGQPTELAVHVAEGQDGQHVNWLKDRKPIQLAGTGKRIFCTADGWSRLLLEKTTLSDQGTYYAVLGDQNVTITLVVEERIDEKELTVMASGTESEDEDVQEYLVPPGSTATIACELEENDYRRDLVWLKDGEPIKFDDVAKSEHVVNGLKHYLVIHDTCNADSGLYSVSISHVVFRVAHLIVNDLIISGQGLKRKRISNSSLYK